MTEDDPLSQDKGQKPEPVKEPGETGVFPRKKRRMLFLLLVILGLLYGMELYSSKPIEVSLNHNIPDGGSLNPSEINIVVWDGDYLWVDTTYYTVQSLTSFSQDLTLSKGTFEVILTALNDAGLVLFQGEAELTVEEAGLYYLQYSPSP